MPAWLRAVLLLVAVGLAIAGSVRYQGPLVRRLVRGTDGRLGRFVLRLVGTYVLVLLVAALLAALASALWDPARPVAHLLCAVAVGLLGPFGLFFLGSTEPTSPGQSIGDEARKAGAGRGQARVVVLLGGALSLVVLVVVLGFGIVLAAVA